MRIFFAMVASEHFPVFEGGLPFAKVEQVQMRCDKLCQLTISSPYTTFRLMKKGFNTSSCRFRLNRLSLCVESILGLTPKSFVRMPTRSDSKGDAFPVRILPHAIACMQAVSTVVVLRLEEKVAHFQMPSGIGLIR
jgi:hypothetical protein